MKRISRAALIVSVILLIIDVMYVTNRLQTMNIIHFLGMVILLPCILLSIIIASLITEIHCRDMKRQAIMAGMAGMVIAFLAYMMAKYNQEYIENIIENSKKMMNSSNVSVSDISISTGVSSYVFIFLMIFVLSMGLSILFNILQERRKKNVSERK